MAWCTRLLALAAALYAPSIGAFKPSCDIGGHSRRVVARATLDDENLISRRVAFAALSRVVGLAGTLVATQPVAAAGPTGGIASALGLGGGVTPFGPVPKQGTTSPSGVTSYDYVVGPGPTPKYGQVLRMEWVRRCLHSLARIVTSMRDRSFLWSLRSQCFMRTLSLVFT